MANMLTQIVLCTACMDIDEKQENFPNQTSAVSEYFFVIQIDGMREMCDNFSDKRNQFLHYCKQLLL